MNGLSLFSGVGMSDYALERLGCRTAAFVEIDDYAHAVMRKRFPHARALRDVREVNAQALAGLKISWIAGGFPCQGVSNAGWRLGLNDPRSALWSEFARLIFELKPELVFIENVSALLGRGLDVVLRDLAEIGYACEWDCIPAAAVGAPHLRDRFWGVAYPVGAAAWQRGVFNEGKGAPTIHLANPPKRLPRAGFMAHGFIREQEPIAPRKTKRLNPGSAWVGVELTRDHGWWHEARLRPTPEASDGSGGRVSTEMGGQRPSGAKRSVTLATAVHHAGRALFPTPVANDDNKSPEAHLAMKERMGGGRKQITSLGVLARNGFEQPGEDASRPLWPTPTRSDGTGGPGSSGREGGDNLRTAVARTQKGALNADWVEWLMGMPIGWTNLVCGLTAPHTWDDEPHGTPRVSEGQPKRKERLTCIGNALVPQVFEWVARRALNALEIDERLAA